jgi:hypothetical protein
MPTWKQWKFSFKVFGWFFLFGSYFYSSFFLGNVIDKSYNPFAWEIGIIAWIFITLLYGFILTNGIKKLFKGKPNENAE